jgi:cellulose synthase/poly-beta-1,6-N-acetylglucosamine synthase-like glycosyltransferase
MFSLFNLALSLLALFYLAILLWLGRGLQRIKISHALSQSSQLLDTINTLPTVALIVCARNEERRLPRLLQALAAQRYPVDKLEICLVDDRSTDRTGEIIENFATRHANVIHVRIDDTLPHFAPKKRAIDAAIRRTTGEIILLTDADAAPGPFWIQEMVSAFQSDVVVTCGYSPYFPRRSFWQKILALEYFSHAAVAAGSIGVGRPLTCTGSNLAYRREAYFRIGGFEGIAQWISGDDDLLLQKMHRAGIGEIRYVADSAAHAPVRPPRTWREFLAQRIRYASKSLHYQPFITLPLLLVYLLNFVQCLGLLAGFLGWWKFFIPSLLISFLKASAEYSYVHRAAVIFAEQKLMPVFPIAAVLHPFYIMVFAALGQFKKFSWRGEEFAAQQKSEMPEPVVT